MRLSERLEEAASVACSPLDVALYREAAALAKRYEDAPVGSLTVEGEHWVFYNGGEAGSVSRVLDKTIRLVEVLP